MAYVHCHQCHWSQDDFWSRSYNPALWFFKYDIPMWIRPRFIGTDPTAVGKSRIARFLRFTGVREIPWPYDEKLAIPLGSEVPSTIREWYQHSWYTLGRQAAKWCRRLFTQKWWTYRGWCRAEERGQGGCPKCGHSLCID